MKTSEKGMLKDLQNRLQSASADCACLSQTMYCERMDSAQAMNLRGHSCAMAGRPVSGTDLPRQGVFYQQANTVCKSLI